VHFTSKPAAIAATVIAGGWTVSTVFMSSHYGANSTPGIWASILGIPGTFVGAWVDHFWTSPSRFGDIVVWVTIAAAIWLGVTGTIVAIKRTLPGT
jgi:hypothetical protein